jgi:hypothetical protein
MRWSRMTVQPFLDVRTAALDGTLENVFRHPAYQPISLAQVADSGGSGRGGGRAAPIRPVMKRQNGDRCRNSPF